MVIDLVSAAPEGWQQDRRPEIPPHARVIWETHVADFSADPAGGIPEPWRGKFMGFTVAGQLPGRRPRQAHLPELSAAAGGHPCAADAHL